MIGLVQRRASFEGSLREPPQDEAFLMPSRVFPHPEVRRQAPRRTLRSSCSRTPALEAAELIDRAAGRAPRYLPAGAVSARAAAGRRRDRCGAPIRRRQGEPDISAPLWRTPSTCCAGRRSARSRRARTTCGASTACCRCCTGITRWRRKACCSARTKASSARCLSSLERRHGFVIRDDLPAGIRGPAGAQPAHRFRPGRRARRSAPGRAGGDRARRSRAAGTLSRAPARGLDPPLAGRAGRPEAEKSSRR